MPPASASVASASAARRRPGGAGARSSKPQPAMLRRRAARPALATPGRRSAPGRRRRPGRTAALRSRQWRRSVPSPWTVRRTTRPRTAARRPRLCARTRQFREQPAQRRSRSQAHSRVPGHADHRRTRPARAGRLRPASRTPRAPGRRSRSSPGRSRSSSRSRPSVLAAAGTPRCPRPYVTQPSRCESSGVTVEGAASMPLRRPCRPPLGPPTIRPTPHRA